jgi:hypothetical protein
MLVNIRMELEKLKDDNRVKDLSKMNELSS